MNDHLDPNADLNARGLAHFRALVESVGVKKFAQSLELSTRQVNRILAGVQPNPVERLVRSLQSAQPDVGDRALDFVCQEVGGYFIRQEATLDAAASSAVRECAEAIAAISDGEITEIDEREVREAIGALLALLRAVGEAKERGVKGAPVKINTLAGTPGSAGTPAIPARSPAAHGAR